MHYSWTLKIYWGPFEVDLQQKKRPGFTKLNGRCNTVTTGKKVSGIGILTSTNNFYNAIFA